MDAKNGMRPVHPGEILAKNWTRSGCRPMRWPGRSACSEPDHAAPARRRGVTADTALRLARYFGTTPQLWLILQQTWELRRRRWRRATRSPRRSSPAAGGVAGRKKRDGEAEPCAF